MSIKDDIHINIGEGKVHVQYVVISKQEEGVVSSYMPGFDIWYSAPDMETAQARGKAMIHNFLHFWITKQSWKRFVVKIHALGFRAQLHDWTMKQLLNHRPAKAGFSPTLHQAPEEIFGKADHHKVTKLDLEMAI